MRKDTMEQTTTLGKCQSMLNQALANGATPLVFLMNQATHQELTDTCHAQAYLKQSRLKRWYFRARKKRLILLAVFGVPIADNNYMPPGMVSLQAIHPFQFQPQPLQQAQPAQGYQQQNADGGTPFQEKLRIEEAPVPDAPTLRDLASSNDGRPGCSDILIKAMERVDDMKSVVVIRVFRNEDVDLCLNCGSNEAVGIIQKAQIWIAMRG
jgi:hypothetical protein